MRGEIDISYQAKVLIAIVLFLLLFFFLFYPIAHAFSNSTWGLGF